MTKKEARKLKIGDRVIHADTTPGTVVDVGYAAIQVRWDDGQFSVSQFNGKDPGLANMRAADRESSLVT